MNLFIQLMNQYISFPLWNYRIALIFYWRGEGCVRQTVSDSSTKLPLEDFLLYHSSLSQNTNCFRWNVSSRTCFSGCDNRVYPTITTISLKLCQNWMRFWSKLCHLCHTCYTPSQQWWGGGRGREESIVKCYKVTSAQHTSHNEVIGSNVNYSYVHAPTPLLIIRCLQRFSLQNATLFVTYWLVELLNVR